MATNLILPEGTRPSNLHLNSETDKVRHVTSDMFNIADRIREISPTLYIVEVERNTKESTRFGFIIMEDCPDGVQRLVFRATKDGMKSSDGGGLDARILERLRYMMALSLHDRIALIDKEREKWEADQAEAASEQLYETMGGEMYRMFHRYGFTSGVRSESYRPMNRAARRAGRRMT